MKTIPAYFDGNTIRPVDTYPFQKDQRLLITVLDDTAEDAEDARLGEEAYARFKVSGEKAIPAEAVYEKLGL